MSLNVKFHLLLSILGLITRTTALGPDGWSKQSIYQVMTDRFARTDGSETASCDYAAGLYCGGSYQGLISKLDYIQGMGFTAIWISPVVKQIQGNSDDGSSYHGYWAQDIWSLNNAFGTEADLKQLATELHNRGMYLMVDVVTNHMAYIGCGQCVNYSTFDPFNDKSYFHDFCLIDYSNEWSTQIQTCWEGDNIVALADLRTEDNDVRIIWFDWIQKMMATYSWDGLRIDSAKHIETSFHPLFEEAAGCYTFGEVLNGDPAYTYPYQQHMSGVTNYPAYYWLKRAFTDPNNTFAELASGINYARSAATNTSLLGNFIENHDQDRWPTFNADAALEKNAIAFIFTMDGIPIVWQGMEQGYSGAATSQGRNALWFSHYNTSTDLYAWIAKLNAVRSHVIHANESWIRYQAYPLYNDADTIVMRKGFNGNQIVSVFTNVGASGASYTVALGSALIGFGAKTEVMDVMGCNFFTTDSNGNLTVTVHNGLPKVLYPRAALEGSGICQNRTEDHASSSNECTITNSQVTFEEKAVTVYGDTVKVVGSVSGLGSWSPANGFALSANNYTASNPVWKGTIALPANLTLEYKVVKVSSSGTVTWEQGPNETLSVPCVSATTVSGTPNF